MKHSKHYSLSKHIPILVCVWTAVFSNLTAQEYNRQSIFDGFTDEHFVFDRYGMNDEYAGGDSEANEYAEADEGSDSGRDSAHKESTGCNNSADGQSEQAEAEKPRSKDETLRQNPEAEHTEPAKTAIPSKHTYFFRYIHGLHKGAVLSAGVSGRSYIGYLQLASPLPVPYFELSVKSFGAGLYPLASLQAAFPQKNIPTLFTGAGGLTFGRFLKTAAFTGYSHIKAGYGGLKFPREYFIGIGSTQKTVHYGVELYGSGWNGAFFASPEPKTQRMRYGLLGGWRMQQKKTGINLSLQYLTVFMPELADETKPSTAASATGRTTAAKSTGKASREGFGKAPRQQYHKLFGLSVIFAHPVISFETAGFCSYAADKTVSGAAQAECDVWYRYAGIRSGVNYTADRAISWESTRQNGHLSAFVQPYVKAGIFSLFTLYALNIEKGGMLHKGGIVIQVKHRILRWSARWDYGKELHTVKTELACIGSPAWFSGTQWFEKAVVGASFELQERALNPLILKKYSIRASGDFRITDGVFCGLSGTFSQSAAVAETEEERVRYMQNPVCSSATFIRFKRNGIDTIHSGKLELSVKNVKPYFDIHLGYQIQSR